jgi:hypothetical protein
MTASPTIAVVLTTLIISTVTDGGLCRGQGPPVDHQTADGIASSVEIRHGPPPRVRAAVGFAHRLPDGLMPRGPGESSSSGQVTTKFGSG